MGFAPRKPTTIFEDNQAVIKMAENPIHHGRTKHLDIRLHALRDYVNEAKLVELKYIATRDNLADLFTKALPRSRFEALREGIGIQESAD